MPPALAETRGLSSRLVIESAGTHGWHVGQCSVLTRRIAEEVLESGASPLQVMAQNMWFFDNEAKRLTEEYNRLGEGDKRREELFQKIGICRRASELCGADAAPYCHPRVSMVSIERGGDEGRLIVHVTGLDALV